MKKLFFIICFFISNLSFAQSADSALILIGQIPGRYFKGVDPHKYVLGTVEIRHRVIQKLTRLKAADLESFKKVNNGKLIINLLREGQKQHDVIYPGLINLHNHTKQNNLSVWSDAQGQFANRFEWRDWPVYKYAVSGNMNPWVDYARAIECATFRWSELSAMVLGTTYLQGPSSCVTDFGILRVEDKDSYISKRAAVQAPTDLVMPNEMEFVWNTLGPIISSGKTYEFALAETIRKHCPTIAVTEQNVNSSEMLKVLKDQVKIKELCSQEGLPEKFIRYVYWIHPTIAGRKNYFQNIKTPPSAVIAHLAEGRRDDEYNQKEYELVKMLGLDLPKMNFVHGVGILPTDFPDLAKKDIGLIWSPFSNLILYSQTLDVVAALQSGVNIAIGSDWVPTGTKSVLEEVKIARNYILKDFDKENLFAAFTSGTRQYEKLDEQLFKMITENPARMINHAEIIKGTVTKTNPSGYVETAVGVIAEGAMGSVIVTSYLDKNPYTNLIKHVDEKSVNLVIIDGKPVYGNTSYLDQVDLKGKYEILPVDSDQFSNLTTDPNSKLPDDATPEVKIGFIASILNKFSEKKFYKSDKCKFAESKAYVTTASVEKDEDLKAFKVATGIDLDKVSDITKLIGINIMTQNRNKLDPVEGKPEYSLKYFPPLYSCNDPQHMKRITNFIKPEGRDDFESNRKYRNDLITKYKLGRAPKQMAEKYK
jgi:hypothetical protein